MEIKCPKCKSSAVTATRTNIPTSQMYRTYVSMSCLTCGYKFDLSNENKADVEETD